MLLNFFRKKDEADWRDLDDLPQEVLSKDELDRLQKEVVQEINNIQRGANITNPKNNNGSLVYPQTLYYCHRYIDAKFDKNNFDVDSYYMNKQNTIDQNYAKGMGDIRSEFTGYKELIEQINEAKKILYEKTRQLDPSFELNLDKKDTYSDAESFQKRIEALPATIDWEKIEKGVD